MGKSCRVFLGATFFGQCVNLTETCTRAGGIAYTSEETGKSRFRFAARIYGVFATVTLAAVGLVFYID